MKRTFHIENTNIKCGSTHNRIVHYATVANVIRYYLPFMPPGQYMIHELSSNMFAPPLKSTPAYRRAA